MLPGPNVPDISPSKVSMIWRPLPSPRSLVVRFPWLLGTSNRSDFLPLFSSGFFLPLSYRSALASSLPCRSERHPTWTWGLFSRLPHPEPLSGNGRISQVPEGPQCPHAMLSDPGRTSVHCRLTPRCCLPPLEQRRLLLCTLSRLNHTAYRLPVYASQDELSHHHATLGSGCRHAWPDWITYPPGPYERFPDRSLLSPFLRLCLAHSKLGFKNPLFWTA